MKRKDITCNFIQPKQLKLFGAVFMSIALVVGMAGCSMHKPQDYSGQQPALELFDYFAGKTYAWGQFQDRSGKVLRRFQVLIDGSIQAGPQGKQLVLDERFLYNDGEREQRIWTIDALPKTHPQFEDGLDYLYRGTAGDVIGEAIGKVAGNALNWKYVLEMPYKDSSIRLNFNDWMFLHEDGVLVNRAKVTKWGFDVGEVTLTFSKSLPAGADWSQVKLDINNSSK